MISGILLAAGHSSRMGTSNKLLLSKDGSPLFLSSLRALQNAKIGELIVVLGHQHRELLPYFKDSKIKLAINGNYLEGQTSSIQAGVQLVNPSSKAFIICLSDMPLIKAKHINDLITAADEQSEESYIVRPYQDGKPGNPSLFSKSFVSPIMDCPEKNGCRSVILSHSDQLIKFETQDEAYFLDIDTPAEYQRFLEKQ